MPLKRRGELARRHPQRRVALPSKQHAPFETLVERALDTLPPKFRRLLADVAIVIEEVPTAEQASLGGMAEDGWLYGLYEGVPATEWGADFAAFPNKISLFQLPLETDFPDPRDLEDEVRITVIHELAHHAGIDDDRLHELDYD
ncbi:MAG: metallopeptidase family protein [Chloroflexota bacterium]|nr:metallopeptidase family protein [Chloroflexota bacterium]